MHFPLLRDIFVIFAIAVAVALVCHRLRVPAVVGLLLTGVLAGPHGLGLVTASHEVEVLAEIGVILLLFTIGIEFSLNTLMRIRRVAFGGGILQVGATAAVVTGVLLAFDVALPQAIFVGMLVALSSTAIILRLLQDRGEIDSPHGRSVLGILIFQDLMIIPMMLLVPLLAGDATDSSFSHALRFIAKALLIAGVIVGGAKWGVPWLFERISRTGSNELFILAVVVICFGIAWTTSLLGLSLALGAFIAGLVISESDFSHRALGSALAFRDVFSSFFFVSIGMLLDLGVVGSEIGFLALAVLSIIVLKVLTTSGAVMALGLPIRIAILAGMALAQMGEFSLVLMRTGLESGVIDDALYNRLLAVAVISMALAPLTLAGSHRVADLLNRAPLPSAIKKGRHFIGDGGEEGLDDHVIIIGYGVIGTMVSSSARLCGIPYVVIDINYETVRNRRAKGEHIFYGDATQAAVLEKAHVDRARMMVVSIPDVTGVRRVVELARRINPELHIIARTRYVMEMQPLYTLGADEVVPEEMEVAVHIFGSVLRRYDKPLEMIQEFESTIRAPR